MGKDFTKHAPEIITELVNEFGEAQRTQIEIGVWQVARNWRPTDGSVADMQEFCSSNFTADESQRLKSFERIETALESIDGHLGQMGRELQWNLDVNTGPLLPIDHLLGSLSLGSHLNDDLYKTGIAHWVLLNYPIHNLAECLKNSSQWSRQKWAEVRLAQRFAHRIPAVVSQAVHDAYVTADTYINGYNIYMGNLRDADGKQLFPDDLRLVTHWGLRDELKNNYGVIDGLDRQRMIFRVMQEIINQEIPGALVDNPDLVWNVAENTVNNGNNQREPDTRYAMLGQFFRAVRQADPYYPHNPTYVDRSFNLYREVPEDKIRELLTAMLASEELKQTGALIRQRLGRDLEPFDIWYNQFRNLAKPDTDELDRILAAKYPTAEAFHRNLPEILQKLGFDRETALFLQSKIDVDASRGIGHAAGASRREDNAHLRTRVPEGGMNYRGYNIAVHELGHNVEQVFSLNRIDHTLLEGVPNTAFTEAFAFIFQKEDLSLMGYESTDELSEHYAALHRLWSVSEIAAVALVDMDVWRWMYANPDFTKEELKVAVIDIAQRIWNEYYYPIIGHRDAEILAVYSHMIDNGLYLPNYPLGHIIEFQIEEYLKDKNLGDEMERMCTIGNVTPDLWMQQAVGQKINVQPILDAARLALSEIDH